jgi:CheY-like chemotaxis protein
MKDRGEVLVVDDDAIFRAILCEILKGEGCSVREASNGRDALEMVRTQVPDLILTDLMMPTMNGWDLYAELARDERFVDVPVAIISTVARMRPLGARMLEKPVKLSQLLALLESILPD